jgi:hypothetical protein
MILNVNLHVSELNAAIALFAGAAEKLRQQAEAQLQPPMPVPAAPAPVVTDAEPKQ